MRLAVGMTTILAFEPPDTRMKRSRMWRSFSLFSAPPMGTIQPRVSPGGILLGIQHSRYWILCRSLPGDFAGVLSVANYIMPGVTHSTLRSILRSGLVAAAAAAFALSALGRGAHLPKSSSDSSTDRPELNTGRDALRYIVQEQCVVNWTQKHDPAPCR